MSSQFVLNSEVHIPILKFLWRWKLATTAAISKKFFPNSPFTTGYKCLMRLKEAGFVQTQPIHNGDGFVWTLTTKGFKVVKDRICELKQVGYRSEYPDHDFLVTALHLGEWLSKKPEGTDYFTEQQLRRYHREFYPTWVPYSEEHRPDGYWLTSGGKVMIALEVELNAKSSDSYEKVFDFYSSEDKIAKVLWLVPSPSLANRIKDVFGKSDQARASVHNFVLLKDFLSHGWPAPIYLGSEKGKTIKDLLCLKQVRNASDSSLESSHQFLLNSKKYPTSYKLHPPPKTHFRN